MCGVFLWHMHTYMQLQMLWRPEIDISSLLSILKYYFYYHLLLCVHATSMYVRSWDNSGVGSLHPPFPSRDQTQVAMFVRQGS